MKKVIVSQTQANKRLDVFLSSALCISRGQVEKAIKKGQVLQSHPKAKKVATTAKARQAIKKTSHKVKQGEVYYLAHLLEPPTINKTLIPVYNIPIPIVFEDKHLLVINKPAGLVTHPAPGHKTDTLVNALKGKTMLSPGSNPLRPGIVHRLDKNVSGLMLISKTQKTQDILIQQFKAKKIKRVYRALTLGSVKHTKATITNFIGRHPRHRQKFFAFDKEIKGAKKAITYYRVLESFKTHLHHVECTLGTGRTHQLRVHLSAHGLPILGERVYSTLRRENKLLKELSLKPYKKLLPQEDADKTVILKGKSDLQAKKNICLDLRLALYSAKLKFKHPVTYKGYEFLLPWPPEFKALFQQLKMRMEFLDH